MKKLSIAYHEIGHAVTAHILGRTNYAAALHQNGGGLSGTGDLSKPARPEDYALGKVGPLLAKRSLQDALDDSTVFAGGCVAEAMAVCSPIFLLAGADRTLVEASCQGTLADTDFQVLHHWDGLAMSRARSILMAHWPVVERLAGMLCERDALSSAEIAAEVAR